MNHNFMGGAGRREEHVLKKLAFLAIILYVVANSYVNRSEFLAAGSGLVQGIFGGAKDGAAARREAAVEPRERVARARDAVQALRRRAEEVDARRRDFLIEAETRRLRKARADMLRAELEGDLRGLAAAAKSARGGEFDFNGRTYCQKRGQALAREWCGRLHEVERQAEVLDKGIDVYGGAAERLRVQLGELARAQTEVAGRIDELEAQLELRSAEREVHDAARTAEGLNHGQVGEAVAALEAEVDRLLASLKVAADEPKLGESSSTAAAAAAPEDTGAVEKLLEKYW
jgi:hypothetical protein